MCGVWVTKWRDTSALLWPQIFRSAGMLVGDHTYNKSTLAHHRYTSRPAPGTTLKNILQYPPAHAGCRVTDKVDCFSFGVVLWEIVTGEWPVRGNLREPLVPEVRSRVQYGIEIIE